MNHSQKLSLLNAAMVHYQGISLRNRANLGVYLSSSVGVGEHQDLVEEVVTLTQKITDADENVRTLEKLIEELPPEEIGDFG